MTKLPTAACGCILTPDGEAAVFCEEAASLLDDYNDTARRASGKPTGHAAWDSYHAARAAYMVHFEAARESVKEKGR